MDAAKYASVLRMLECCLAPDTSLQAEAYAALQRYKADPEFLVYLSAVLSTPSDVPIPVRTVAGMAIKRIVDEGIVFGLPKPVQGGLLRDLLRVLGIADAALRKTTANIISAIVRRVGVEQWPALLPALSSMLDARDEAPLDGALRCLHHLAEDAAALDSAELGHPLNELVPKLIRLMGSEVVAFRRAATECMLEVSGVNCAAVATNTDAFIQALAALTGDPAPGLRALVARCFTVVLGTSRPALWPHIRPVLAFVVSCLEEGVAGGAAASTVAMAACQFLAELSEVVAQFAESHPQEFAVPLPFFPRLCELLMTLSVFSDEDLALQQWPSTPDAGQPDKVADVKPKFHKAATSGAGSTAVDKPSSATGAEGDGGAAHEDDEDDEEDEDGGDEDIDVAAAVSKWTVRQEASNALEVMAMVYKEEISRPLLPVLSAYLSATGAESAQWRRREAGILVLGTLFDPLTCYDELAPHAAGLYPFLLDCTRDAVPQVRHIAAWALGKMAVWIVEAELEAEPGAGAKPIARLLTALCPLIGDPYKRVQAAGLHALTTFIESANEVLAPYVAALGPVLVSALASLQVANRLLLYDVIGMLAEAVPGLCSEAGLFAALVPGLSARYAATGAEDTDPEFGPLLTCITTLIRADYSLLRAATPAIVSRCFAAVQGCLAADAAARAAGEHEAGVGELLSTALDALDSIVVGADAEAPGLFAPYAAGLPDLLAACVTHTSPAVRRAAFALLGDTASIDGAWPLLAPHAAAFVSTAVPSMRNEPGNQDACNNAVWSAGILLSRLGTAPPDISAAVTRVFTCLSGRNTSAVLAENCVIFLGRVGCLAPDVVSRGVPSALAAKRWLSSLPSVTDPDEARYAFLGAASVLQRNPGLADGAFNVLAAALASFGGELNTAPYPPDIQAAAQATLSAVCSHLAARGEAVPRLISRLPGGVYKRLNDALGGQLPPRG